mmetsp:Transcript_16224/g.44452  ORF Transcript_16224/g.44452 Transcript_16224/m.44452 type:complete len:207 (+) Transcript_16224:256-876(+)
MLRDGFVAETTPTSDPARLEHVPQHISEDDQQDRSGSRDEENQEDREQHPTGVSREVQDTCAKEVHAEEVALLFRGGEECLLMCNRILLCHAHEALEETDEPTPLAWHEVLVGESPQGDDGVEEARKQEETDRADHQIPIKLRGLVRRPKEDPLVRPVCYHAIEHAHDVQDRHSTRVHDDAEHHVQVLGLALTELPLRQLVQQVVP